MTALTIDGDAAELGFGAARLERIDAHFRRYVDDGRLPGWQLAITRRGKVVYASTYGLRDKEAGLPVEPDTIFRIYSMTKPITSVAAMMLYEEGAFELKEPLHHFIPAFQSARVWHGGSSVAPLTEPMAEPIRIWHLLTHTSGLTYGFHYAHPVDELYRKAGFDFGSARDLDLAGACEKWATLPLLFQPGSRWNYSVATDVLGRVVEVISGLSLDEFFAQRIFAPLGMKDSGFNIANDSDRARLAALYVPQPRTKQAMRYDALGAVTHEPPTFLSGGGGLVSTAYDYHRFTQMLVRGGELDGARLLGTRTLRYMTTNHLPGGLDLEAFGQSTFAETTFDGVGFGLGFSVVDDPVKNKVLGSRGEFGWGGAASTAFWVDPAEAITALFFTQLLPSNTHPIRPQLRQLVTQALVD